MKSFNKKVIAALVLLPTISLAAPITYETNVPVDHVYIPSGFDSNDNAEAVVTGFLPNLCYKAPKSSVVIKNGKISVSVKAIKNIAGGRMNYCASVIVPYSESINIGVLDKGKYKVSVNESSSWELFGNINVAEASSNSIDDEVYANVSEVTRLDKASRKVVLKGSNPSDCFELKEISIINNGTDTYSILPKMKQVKDFCIKKMIPFTYEIEVPQKLDADKVLLHVRVMDGRSINTFFNNKPMTE